LDLKYKNGVATLSINEVFPEDEGQYVCEATNSMGTAKTMCKLTVKRKYKTFIRKKIDGAYRVFGIVRYPLFVLCGLYNVAIKLELPNMLYKKDHQILSRIFWNTLRFFSY